MPPARDAADAAIALRHELSEMQRLSDWIDCRVAALALTHAVAYAVRLCVEEAVLNIITHNRPPADPAAAIRVWLSRCNGRPVARIEDRCAPFDPLAVPEPARAESLAEAPLGGLGIPLMRRFASVLEYRREHDTNLLVLRFDG